MLSHFDEVGRTSKNVNVYVFVSLFGDEKEVVLLAFLDDDVFVVEEHVGRCGRICVADFLFVDGNAALLGEFAHLAF